MTPNKRDLKAYSRFDGTGRIVPGSTVLRRNKPKNGNWKEVQAYECCNAPVILTFDIPDPEISGFRLLFYCNGVLLSEAADGNYGGINISDLIIYLTQRYPMLGTWSNPSGNIIELQMSQTQKEVFCPTGTLTFEILPD